MNLFTQMARMETIYNVKPRYAIRLKFGDKFLTFLTKSELEVKVSSICLQSKKIYFHIA